MRDIHVDKIREGVKTLVQEANYNLPNDIFENLKKWREREKSPTGKSILDQILQNAELAAAEKSPLCQDTGLSVFFVELGQDAHIVGGSLIEAINDAVRDGYEEGYLRKSVCHPFTRKNTTTNTPAIIHTQLVAGDGLKIGFAAKGGGSENMSKVIMMKPADGKDGIVREVVEWVRFAGGNPCPPIIVGVGIGGNFERSAYLAKLALTEELGRINPDAELAEMEADLLERINRLGIGPMGMGGITTAIGVHINMEPCHIASLPVAINIQCHSARHKEIEL